MIQYIYLEDLKLKKISESDSKDLNRELRNSCISKLVTYLKYKCKKIIEVNPRNTTKTCNQCGKIHDMPYWKRTMTCDCGLIEDRDINVSKNIYCLGQTIQSGTIGCTVTINKLKSLCSLETSF